MTDQDKIPRFADGEPVHPFGKPERPWRTLAAIALTWAIVIFVLVGSFYAMFSLIAESRAHADEPTLYVFASEDCSIDADLHVTGPKRAACVERLATAARLARSEMLINDRRASKR